MAHLAGRGEAGQPDGSASLAEEGDALVVRHCA